MIHEFMATKPNATVVIIWFGGLSLLITIAAIIWLLLQSDKPQNDYRKDADDWMDNK